MVLLLVGFLLGVGQAVLLGWRPAEFQDIYALGPKVRRQWVRDYDAAARRFVRQLEGGEAFQFTLRQEAINGLLSERLIVEMRQHLKTDMGFSEPQLACEPDRLVFMVRSAHAGGAILSMTIRPQIVEPGRCRVRVSDVRIGAVPLDEAFVAERAAWFQAAADRLAAVLAREKRRKRPRPSLVSQYSIRQNAYGSLAAILGGKVLEGARGVVGEGLHFRIERIRIRRGAIDFGVLPGPGGEGSRPGVEAAGGPTAVRVSANGRGAAGRGRCCGAVRAGATQAAAAGPWGRGFWSRCSQNKDDTDYAQRSWGTSSRGRPPLRHRQVNRPRAGRGCPAGAPGIFAVYSDRQWP
jgi:hypothetical protein